MKDDTSDNNNNAGSSGSRTSTAKILLPGKDYVLERWKATDGASVRAGETVAFATTTRSRLPQPPRISTTHKRPKKRKRGAFPSAGAIASNSSGTGGETVSDSSTTDSATGTTHSATTTWKKPTNDEEESCKSEENATEPKVVLLPIVAPSDGILRIQSGGATRSLEIGWMEACWHPTIMGGLCAVCGQQPAPSSFSAVPVHQPHDKDTSNHQQQPQPSRQVTVSGGITMTLTEAEAQQMAAEASRKLARQRKLALVLDLDHTLVHATADPRAGLYRERDDDDVRTLVLPLLEHSHPSHPQHGCTVQHYVKLRPHVKEFLRKALEEYEVSVYTAGTRLYAQQVTTVLCRHLVGAALDQPELDRLQREYHVAKLELEAKQQQPETKAAARDTKGAKKEAAETKNDDGDLEKQAETETDQKKSVKMTDTNDGDGSKLPQNGNRMGDAENDDAPGSNASKIQSQQQQQRELESDDAKKSHIAANEPTKKVSFGALPASLQTDAAQQEKENDGEKITSSTANEAPKKVVSFGAPPASLQTDVAGLKQPAKQVTAEYVKSLERKWLRAERLEAEAAELRQGLFGSRIVSRTDVGDLGRDVKDLKRIFPCGGIMTAIVDDREDVWAKAEADEGRRGEPPENLLIVRPYHWKPFLGFADVNNPSGKTDFGNTEGENETQTDDDNDKDKETDEQLLWTSNILDRLHKRFYGMEENRPDRTVPCILRGMRQEVLAGKRLVLSGLVPLERQQQQRDGVSRRPTIVRYAECLGAKVSDTVRSDTTHVVAARDGTDKTVRARTIAGCVVVKALWLTECLWSLTLRDATPHLLGPPPDPTLRAKADAAAQSKTHFSSSSSSDSSDDDLAAEIENELMETM